MIQLHFFLQIIYIDEQGVPPPPPPRGIIKGVLPQVPSPDPFQPRGTSSPRYANQILTLHPRNMSWMNRRFLQHKGS